MKTEFNSLVDMLNLRSHAHPDRVVFTFDSGLANSAAETITYDELNRRAQAIAVHLQQSGANDKPAILIFDCGLEFITSFFGCIYSGTIPAPLYPPFSKKQLDRLLSIILDCDASTILVTSQISNFIKEIDISFPVTSKINWVEVDTIDYSIASQWQHPEIANDTIALLQYTSGSTGKPKGVLLSHQNLLSNFQMIRCAMSADETDIMVSWLPMYHDMGLIGAILHSVYSGMQTVSMPPSSVVRPFRWLSTISKYRGTATVAPNFAYDFCVQRIMEDDIKKLDLSSLRVAFNGSEPIHDSTLKNFHERFKSAKLRDDTFLPCYGLAEASLIVSGRDMSRPIEFKQVENLRNKVFVGCGVACKGSRIRIVDSDTRLDCAAGSVGEIWVAGPSVARGYWNHPQANEESFIRDLDKVWLRTGDLGFVDEKGELFITGRIKDLIIIRGKNYHPQDLEFIAQGSHSVIQNRPSSAFGVDSGSAEERVVLLQELKQSVDEATRKVIATSISDAIAREEGIQLSEIIFIPPNSLARTSSGKIRRSEMRRRYLQGEL
jgi:acyl-CoA synthetase (AMP-forming)/AMP-acid ligase II